MRRVVRLRRLVITLAAALAVVTAACVLPSTSLAQSASKSSHKKSSSSSAKKKGASSRKAKKKSAKRSLRLLRMKRAFVASETLKPMARQLLQDRTPAAYAGVENYARKHPGDDAGSLAWLVLGYAHFLDRDYPKAIDALSRAKPEAGDLGDYVDYYLATAYAQSGRTSEALGILSKFNAKYPGSLLHRDAKVQYANALLSQGQAEQALRLLENDRRPTRPDVELAVGRAYEGVAQNSQAVQVFKNVYLTMPISGEAPQAYTELTKLMASGVPLQMSFAERRARADLLTKARHYNDAIAEYGALADNAPANEKPKVQLALAETMRQAGQNRDAKKILDAMPDFTKDVNCEKYYNLGEIARSSGDQDAFLGYVQRIRQEDPSSPWLEDSLLSLGNMYLLKKDYDQAITAYGELVQKFPRGEHASYAQWKVAWLNLRQNRKTEAKQGFEKQIELYPNSSQASAALYWRGRLAQEDGDAAMAKAFYIMLTQRYRNYYYGGLARQQLKGLTQVTAGRYAVLDHVAPLDAKVITADVPDEDDLRVQKARLLENGALTDFAIRELRAAAEEDHADWLPIETARMYQELGRYDLALQALKRAVPSYFAIEQQAMPRAYWEALFPKPYWNELQKFSVSNGLDPYLVASLIRQESEFNPTAVSHANAVGLMQLLPSVGKSVAREEKVKHFDAAQLFVPAVNLQLGTKYFRSMVDKFGAFEYALAAYNAGDSRVQDWLAEGKYRDPQEFVESIPFTETREYVQAILRNANMYRQLYSGAGSETVAKSGSVNATN